MELTIETHDLTNMHESADGQEVHAVFGVHLGLTFRHGDHFCIGH